MRIGVPREIKSQENRVALRPVGAEILTRDGHEVWIERGAGGGSGFTDDAYGKAGARLVDGPEPVFAECEMILKVKEPLAEEIRRIPPGQIVFTYFHFAASRELTEGMIGTGAVALAYETVEEENGGLPLLVPMSEVAGRMAVQEGAKYLEKLSGGRGILLGGVPGTPPGEVVILGGGVVGTNAAKMAAGELSRVEVLKVLGMVNAVPEFTDQPKVINGCSDLFVAVLGERGRHARSAVGMGSLPMDISVEIEAVLRIHG